MDLGNPSFERFDEFYTVHSFPIRKEFMSTVGQTPREGIEGNELDTRW